MIVTDLLEDCGLGMELDSGAVLDCTFMGLHMDFAGVFSDNTLEKRSVLLFSYFA